MEAFAGAIALGCDAIELDCHLVRGELVVAHDLVAGASLDALPRLADVVRLVARSSAAVRLWIELKTAPMCDGSSGAVETAEAVVALLRREAFAARATIVAFDWSGPLHARRMEPALETLLTTPAHLEGSDLVDAIADAGGGGWFAHRSSVTPATVARAKARGLSVAAWTVNEAADLAAAIAVGCDAICTDFPDRLARALAEGVDGGAALK